MCDREWYRLKLVSRLFRAASMEADKQSYHAMISSYSYRKADIVPIASYINLVFVCHTDIVLRDGHVGDLTGSLYL